MIIRSQYKRKITTDLNLYIETKDSMAIGTVTCWVKNNTMGILGTYSSWEKAFKVLDMIQNAYEEANSVCTMSGFVANTVFKMPQDSEV